jgi:hypothetical protein
MEVDAIQVENLLPVSHHISRVKPICGTADSGRQIAVHVHIEVLVYQHLVLFNCGLY